MADHDQQKLIELDGNENPKVVFKVSIKLVRFFFQVEIFVIVWNASSIKVTHKAALVLGM